MSETTAILEIDKPHFNLRLYQSLLKIDLKGSVKNEIEEALENKPLLKETIGGILSIFIPLNIRLSHIGSVHADETGKVRISLPLHRDIVIPLEADEAKKLVDKLNELIPIEKERELEHAIEERKIRKKEEEELANARASATSGVVPIPQPPGVLAKLKKAEEKIEEK